MSAQQRMKVANEKASKNITQRGNVVKPVSKNSEFFFRFSIFVSYFFKFLQCPKCNETEFVQFLRCHFQDI